MMKCRDYVFQLTSGQLDGAPLATRLEARMHRWVCVRCRAFTHNDQVLGEILERQRERVKAVRPGDPDHDPSSVS